MLSVTTDGLRIRDVYENSNIQDGFSIYKFTTSTGKSKSILIVTRNIINCYMIEHYSLNCRGKLLNLRSPKVMGILNLTPDSFSDGGKYNELTAALNRVEEMLMEGADIVDIGGYSSRPYSIDISVEEEISRIDRITREIMVRFPEAIISVDTFRSRVAEQMLQAGVHMINDISSSMIDPDMIGLVSQYQVPYIMMHMKGTPQTMQDSPQYIQVVDEIIDFLCERISFARANGIYDLVVDPGFGFGKTIQHNYQILSGLDRLSYLGVPVLAGLSRKSMLYKLLDTAPDDVVEVASALHLQALMRGVNILRVHDVKAARRIVEIYEYMKAHGTL